MYTTYQGISDLVEMAELVTVSNTLLKAKSQLHLGNLVWRLRKRDLANSIRKIAMWRDEGNQIKSFVIVHDERPADIQLHPEFVSDTGLIDEMVAWVEAITVQHDIKIGCLSSATTLESVLVNRGYSRNSILDSYVRMERELSQSISEPRMPTGYQMQDLSESSELNSFISTHNAVFPGSVLLRQDYERLGSTRIGVQDFRYVLVDSTSATVAFAFSWLDYNSGCLEFEPVGCRLQWRRKGLATFLMKKLMRIAFSLGAKYATLTARSSSKDAISFYKSLEFEQKDIEFVFSKAVK